MVKKGQSKTYIQPFADLQDPQRVLEDVLQGRVPVAAGDPQHLHVGGGQGQHDALSVVHAHVHVQEQLLHPVFGRRGIA